MKIPAILIKWLDKIQYQLMIKTLSKPEIEGNFLKCIKDIYVSKVTYSKCYFNDEIEKQVL